MLLKKKEKEKEKTKGNKFKNFKLFYYIKARTINAKKGTNTLLVITPLINNKYWRSKHKTRPREQLRCNLLKNGFQQAKMSRKAGQQLYDLKSECSFPLPINR